MKAAGPDETFVEALKINVDKSVEILATVWETCGRLATIPEAWKRAQLYPIFKKGSRKEAKN